MKKIFYIVMSVVFLATTIFNLSFAYSNIECVGCATMLFLAMTALTSVIIATTFRHLYKTYEEGKLDFFKQDDNE